MKVNYFDTNIRHELLHKIQAAVQTHVEAQIKDELQKVNPQSFGHDAEAIEEVLNYLQDELVVAFKGMEQIWFPVPMYTPGYTINRAGVLRDPKGRFVKPSTNGEAFSYPIKSKDGHKHNVSAAELLHFTFDGYSAIYDDYPENITPWEESEDGYDGYTWHLIPGFSNYLITPDKDVHPLWKVKAVYAPAAYQAKVEHTVNYDLADVDGNPTTSYILTSDDGVREKYTYHELLKMTFG